METRHLITGHNESELLLLSGPYKHALTQIRYSYEKGDSDKLFSLAKKFEKEKKYGTALFAYLRGCDVYSHQQFFSNEDDNLDGLHSLTKYLKEEELVEILDKLTHVFKSMKKIEIIAIGTTDSKSLDLSEMYLSRTSTKLVRLLVCAGTELFFLNNYRYGNDEWAELTKEALTSFAGIFLQQNKFRREDLYEEMTGLGYDFLNRMMISIFFKRERILYPKKNPINQAGRLKMYHFFMTFFTSNFSFPGVIRNKLSDRLAVWQNVELHLLQNAEVFRSLERELKIHLPQMVASIDYAKDRITIKKAINEEFDNFFIQKQKGLDLLM